MRRAVLCAAALSLIAPVALATPHPGPGAPARAHTHSPARAHTHSPKRAPAHGPKLPLRRGPTRSVPYGFAGVMADGPLLDPAAPLDDEFRSMVRTGVESVRFVTSWAAVQPYSNLDAVPVADRARFTVIDGIPTDFTSTDRLVQAAALRGMQILPIVFGCPAWARKDADRTFSPPADPAAYGRFVGVLERRYGPGGSFWRSTGLPYDPVRDWQIWNEPAGGATPNGPSDDWDDPEPFQQRYVAMLRAARAQVKATDPRGRIILAGNFGFSWLATDAIYRAHGRGAFDAVALNIFTRRISDALDVVRHNRAAMNRYGDRRLPIMVTEITWPSSLGKIQPSAQRDYEVTPGAQAGRLTSMLRLFAAFRHAFNIERVFWNTWAASDTGSEDPFIYAGLRVITPNGYVAKPAQHAFALAALKLEGCSKLSSALRCGP